jgi:O-antigen/teichoic acid export membrane protein
MSKMAGQFMGGMKWTSISTVTITVVQLIQFALLARLLTPEDYGLMGMIMVVILFSNVFTDMGISSAIIHKQDTSKEQLSSLYWLNLFAGFVVFVILNLIIPLISDFYNEVRLNELLRVVSFMFIIIPFGQQFQYLLQKNLKFNILAKIEMTSIIIGSITAIILATLGFGVWSLVWGQISTAVIKSVNLVIVGYRQWRPRIRFKRNDLKGYLSFGLYQMGSRTVNYFASNIDYLLIGRFLGSEALGLYTLAYQLIVIPVTKINPIITKVAFPVFSLNQHDNKVLTKGFIQMSKALSYITFPILIGLIATAEIFVPVVFGEKWNDAIIIIQILSLLGILRVLMNPNGSVLLAKGRADLGFKWDLFVALINGVAILSIVQQGVTYVASVYVAVSALNFILGRKLLDYVFELKAAPYFKALAYPALSSTLMGLGVYGTWFLLKSVDIVPSWFSLVPLVILGVLLYIGLTLLFDRETIRQIKSLILKKKGKVI